MSETLSTRWPESALTIEQAASMRVLGDLSQRSADLGNSGTAEESRATTTCNHIPLHTPVEISALVLICSTPVLDPNVHRRKEI